MTGIRQTIATLVLMLTAVVGWVVAPTTLAEDRWVEGQHYQALTPPVAVGRGSPLRARLPLRPHKGSRCLRTPPLWAGEVVQVSLGFASSGDPISLGPPASGETPGVNTGASLGR